eukprot:RCo021337
MKPVTPPPTDELLVTTHFLFCNCSIWPEFPECLSCRQIQGVLCCFQAQECGMVFDFKVCCKSEGKSFCLDLAQLQPLKECLLCASAFSGRSCCICEGGAESACGFPKTCCKCAVQEFCIDCRAALPPDNDVPLACSILGYYFYGQKGSGFSPPQKVGPATASMS